MSLLKVCVCSGITGKTLRYPALIKQEKFVFCPDPNRDLNYAYLLHTKASPAPPPASACASDGIQPRERAVRPIVAVCTNTLTVTSDQEAYHSCFRDLISRAWAKPPSGRQFSFFLIGALIRSEKHIAFPHSEA